MDAKEKILTYVKQFDTDAAIGLSPDRTKRPLLRRIHHMADAKQAYAALLAEHEIHEEGIGKPGSPVIVVLGPPPSKPVMLPHPYVLLEQLDLLSFMVRIMDTYEANGWSPASLDYKAEFKKALSEYQPGRPY